ncbi:MAG: nuclear transport factor 2 family protein [Caulobacteraceae bacterium]|nr:nuclear transport factor 2 family protein [Caulobacteraceae bacterium]
MTLSSSGQDEMEVRQLEARRQAALVALDMEALADMFAEDMIHVHTNGMVHDKAAILSHIRSRAQFVAVERRNLVVRVYGDTALLTGDLINSLRIADEEEPRIMKAFATQVMRRTDGVWRFVSFHACLGLAPA